VSDTQPKKPDRRPPQLRKPHGPRKSPREQFLRRYVPFVKYARRGLRRVAKLGNSRWHEYTQDEANAILKALRDDMSEVERAFRGAPKERGLFDL
jgi:hypothetical protein